MGPYTTMGLAGLAAGFVVVAFNLRQTEPWSQNRKTRALVLGICGAGMLMALVFARLGNILQQRTWDWELFQLLRYGGYTWYAGEIGALATLALLLRAAKLNVGEALNLIVPAFPLVHAFGRVGCALSGCCYGAPTGLSLFGRPLGQVPTQILEAVFCAGLFIVLEFAVQRHRVLVNCVAYAVFRFFLEFWRGDERGALVPGVPFSPAQQIALGCLLAAGGWLLWQAVAARAPARPESPKTQDAKTLHALTKEESQ